MYWAIIWKNISQLCPSYTHKKAHHHWNFTVDTRVLDFHWSSDILSWLAQLTPIFQWLLSIGQIHFHFPEVKMLMFEETAEGCEISQDRLHEKLQESFQQRQHPYLTSPYPGLAHNGAWPLPAGSMAVRVMKLNFGVGSQSKPQED